MKNQQGVSMKTIVLSFAIAAGIATTLLAQRVEPISATSTASPVKFDRLDVAHGSLVVFGARDVWAPVMGIGEARANSLQITGKLQVFAVSGGEPTRVNFVCATAKGIIFGSATPCDQVTLAREE